MKDDKLILNSVIPSKTEHFTSTATLTNELVHRQNQIHTDEIDGKKCRINASGVLDTEIGSFRLKENGFAQMLGRLGIPRGYANRIPNDLLQHDINRLFLEKGTKTKLVRDGETVRGFLPANRVSVPNLQLFRHLSASFEEANLELSQAELSDNNLRVKVLSPGMKMTIPRVGDVYSVGLDINNSDVGSTSLSANAFTLCLKCTNGVVAPKDVWGIRKSRFAKGADQNNMLATFIMDVAHIATKLDRMQECIAKSTELPVTEEQLGFLAGVVKSVVTDEEQAKTKIGQFSLKSNVYEVQYAITELSQKMEDIRQRRHVELFAGKMLFGDDRMLVNFSLN